MPFLATLAELRPLVRSIAAVQRIKFIDDADLNPWLVAAWARLYDLVAQSGSAYFERDKDITLQTGTAIPIPSDMQALRRVDYLDGTRPVELRDLDVHEVGAAQGTTASPLLGISAEGYRFRAQEIQLPLATVGQKFRVTYIPRCSDPRDATGAYLDTAAMDCVSIKGRDWVVLMAGVRVLQKQREDTSQLAAEAAVLRHDIEVTSTKRTAGRLHRVAEVVSFDDPYLVGWRGRGRS